MRIIGHRGAAGLALENTRQGLLAAGQLKLDGIEIDLHLTKDSHLVAVHDRHTGRISPTKLVVQQSTWVDLQKLLLHNNETIIDLLTAQQLVGNVPLFIELKGRGWAEPLAKSLGRPPSPVRVLSFNHIELRKFQQLRPTVAIYALSRLRPFHTIHLAQRHRFQGVDLPWPWLNPLTYYLARRANLDIIIYTVNQVWLGRLLARLYPNIAITTDRPDKFRAASQ